MHLLFLRTVYACLLRSRRQPPLQFTTFRKMNYGRNSSAPPRDTSVGVHGSSLEPFSGVLRKNSRIEMPASQQKNVNSNFRGHACSPMSQKPYDQNISFGSFSNFSHSKTLHHETDTVELADIGSNQPDSQSASLFKYETAFPLLPPNPNSSRSEGSNKNLHTMRTKVEVNSADRMEDVSSAQLECLPTVNSIGDDNESCLLSHFDKKGMASYGKKPKQSRVCVKKAARFKKSDRFVGLPMDEPFDICPSGVRSTLSASQVLRPGMVLLKSYISLGEQIEIVKKCRDLGLGPGGFYRPSYRDGAKLRLQMMCLGLDWDLETRKYSERRQFDGSKPPDIPWEFGLLVEKAIQDSHFLINEERSTANVENILPWMSPNICIVNFYTTSGRLGLHQDRDESPESLRMGLPVVSFSFGDSAEFLYGDHRDVNKAEKVVLESGDVLIFGGRSRHIFHGVKSIVPDSAPMALRLKSQLRPGRLNLTFRQF